MIIIAIIIVFLFHYSRDRDVKLKCAFTGDRAPGLRCRLSDFPVFSDFFGVLGFFFLVFFQEEISRVP